MAITRYEPFSLLNQLQREMSNLFEGGRSSNQESGLTASDWVPAVDIKEEDGQFVLHADVPGINPDDIEITMENGVLTIKGQREHVKREEQDRYRRVERVRGTFFRRFTLPDTADAEKISARTENGVLEVVIPKGTKAQPRKIMVNH